MNFIDTDSSYRNYISLVFYNKSPANALIERYIT